MKKIILYFFFACVSIGAFSQDSCSLQCLFENYCDKHIAEGSDTLCTQTCIFVKFQIDNYGSIKNIFINANTSIPLKDLIVDFLKTTNKKWNKRNENNTLLLPVVFSIHKGKCVVKEQVLRNVIQILQFDDDSSHDQVPSFLGYKNEMPLDCTLLNPIIYSSPIDSR